MYIFQIQNLVSQSSANQLRHPLQMPGNKGKCGRYKIFLNSDSPLILSLSKDRPVGADLCVCPGLRSLFPLAVGAAACLGIVFRLDSLFPLDLGAALGSFARHSCPFVSFVDEQLNLFGGKHHDHRPD